MLSTMPPLLSTLPLPIMPLPLLCTLPLLTPPLFLLSIRRSSQSPTPTPTELLTTTPRPTSTLLLTFLKMIGILMLGPRIPAAHIHSRSQYRRSRCCQKGTPRKCQRGEGLGHQEQGQKVRELQRSGLMWH